MGETIIVVEVTKDSGKFEAIYTFLEPLWEKATGKWKKCQWNYPVGMLKLINLKGLTTVDIHRSVEEADDRLERSLKLLQEKYSYSNLVQTALEAEWKEYGGAARSYLETIEWAAREAESTAMESLRSLVEGRIEEAAESASRLLYIESTYSKKKVWRVLATETLEVVNALQTSWEPRVYLNIDGERVLLGDNLLIKRSEQVLRTPKEWNAVVRGSKVPFEWLIREGSVWRFGKQLELGESDVLEAL